MRPTTSRSTAIAIVALAIACGDDPKTNLPTAPGVPAFGTLAITGPDNVAPGQSAQYTAIVTLSDGMAKTATNATNIRWTTSNVSRLRVDAFGMATGLNQVGDITLTAEATVPGSTARIRSTKEVTVQPAGTFRLIGTVLEADTSEPIAGARVGVLPSTSTVGADSLGRYRLYGVPPAATIRVSSLGYETTDQVVHLTANSTQDVRLNISGTRISLSGPYTFTVEAANSCASNLPAELRQRSYDATITQNGNSFDVRLTEPRFRLDNNGLGNHFTGTNRGGTATFELRSVGYYYYYFFYIFSYPDVAERLSDGTFFVADGFATTTQSGGGVTGSMSGGMARYNSSFPGSTSFMGGCFASNHKFTLTPR